VQERVCDESALEPLTVLCVVVLYKMRPSQSMAVRSLQCALSDCPPGQKSFSVLLYDNTPVGSGPGPLPEDMMYESAGQNGGLAAAYNRAMDLAGLHGCSWLLLLDQDTAVPPDFIESTWAQMTKHDSNASVAAVVPMVQSGGVAVSPKRVGFFGLGALRRPGFGIQECEVMAINSGTLIRCDFVRSIGGFNRAYWLDFLDHWLFRQIYAAGRKVVVSECKLEHKLSVQDYRQNVSVARYRSILAGEAGFMTTHKAKSQIPFYLFRLLVRSARLAIQRQPAMTLLTLATVARIAKHPSRSLEGKSL